MNRVAMTKEGAEKLQEELVRLKQVERPEVVAAIAEAREHGDLKENAEYHAAREKQSFIEGRILTVEGSLANGQIIDVTEMTNNGKVIFGATVTLIDSETEEEVTYQIVGHDEADIKVAKISYQSPIAKAIIGKMVDDEVLVFSPGGEKNYEIAKVEYI